MAAAANAPKHGLVELLTRESEIYVVLRKMVSRELEAIVLNEDMDELLEILNEKQKVISQLQLLMDSWGDVLDSAGVTLRRGDEGFWDLVFEVIPPEEGPLLSAALERTKELSADLLRAEDNAMAELEKHAEKLRGALSEMSHGKKVAAGYAKYGMQGSAYTGGALRNPRDGRGYI